MASSAAAFTLADCAYDDNGNVTQLTYPGGKVLTLVPDVMNRVEQIKEGANVIAAYDYNALGQPVRLDLKNGTYVQYAYDAAGRLKVLGNFYPEGNVLSAFTYARTPAGDPTRITYQDGRYRTYTYDDLHRLTGETHTR
ncbi:MAG: RHS repeat protein, partial [Verrucomicrobia bacterium]|nr:RHS repeat protein [Verrucomicrobiota bacterium]